MSSSEKDEAEQLVQELGQQCLRRRVCLSAAESCTGGGVAEMITRVPGSSAWFECGFVVYTNLAKQRLLDVPASVLAEHGAVSEPTALAMAEGVLRHSASDLSVAVTGIAGPSGGSEAKPMGTVCFAWLARVAEPPAARSTAVQTSYAQYLARVAEPFAARSTTVRFTGHRAAVRRQACLRALRGLLESVVEGLGKGGVGS